MNLKRFGSDRRGSLQVVMALSALPLMMMGGIAIDMGAAQSRKVELQASVDYVALLLAKRSALNPAMTAQQLVSDGKALLARRISEPITYSEFYVDPGGIVVRIDAGIDYETVFAGIVGKDTIPVTAAADSRFRRKNIEIAVTVDTTNSMDKRLSGKTRLEGAKEAIQAFTDAVMAGTNTALNTSVKLALVPFDNQVKVLGDDEAERIEADPFRAITWADAYALSSVHRGYLPLDRWQTYRKLRQYGGDKYGWSGCFEMRPGKYTYSVSAPYWRDRESLFVPFLAPDQPDNRDEYDNYKSPNSYLPDQGPACSSPRAPEGTDAWERRELNVCKYDDGAGPLQVGRHAEPGSYAYVDSNPNGFCTDNNPVFPLSTDIDTFRKSVNALSTRGSWGGTIMPVGFYWAWNALDRAEPLPEAAPAGEADKYIIFLSDGKNSVHPLRYNSYSPFGYPGDARWDAAAGWDDDGNVTRDEALHSMTYKMCDAIKADPASIKVYFVYYLDKYDAEAEAIGKHCASGDDKFIYATDRDKLIETFRKIGQEISRLRLVPYEVSSTGKSQ